MGSDAFAHNIVHCSTIAWTSTNMFYVNAQCTYTHFPTPMQMPWYNNNGIAGVVQILHNVILICVLHVVYRRIHTRIHNVCFPNKIHVRIIVYCCCWCSPRPYNMWLSCGYMFVCPMSVRVLKLIASHNRLNI